MDSFMDGCSVFNSSVKGLVTFRVKSLRIAFWGCYAFNQPLTDWDTSNVTSFKQMLQYCVAFDQDMGHLNIGSLTNAQSMLGGGGLSTANYDSTLIGWAAQSAGPYVADFGNSKYTAGGLAEVSRNTIIAQGNTLLDGGAA
jgi:surface protein